MTSAGRNPLGPAPVGRRSKGDARAGNNCRAQQLSGSGRAALIRLTRSALSRADQIGVKPIKHVAGGVLVPLAHRENVLLIPGTSRLQHLEANLEVQRLRLPDDALAELDAVG